MAPGLHVGTISLEKLNHLNVAVQTCEVEGCEAVFVLHIDPGLELVLERRVTAVVLHVLFGEGFEMHDVDFEFGEFVLEGGEVEEGGLVFLLEQGEVEFGPVLEVRPQVLIAFDAHDGVDGPGLGRRLLFARHHCSESYN